jgi:hypothetical protein
MMIMIVSEYTALLEDQLSQFTHRVIADSGRQVIKWPTVGSLPSQRSLGNHRESQRSQLLLYHAAGTLLNTLALGCCPTFALSLVKFDGRRMELFCSSR